MTGNITETARRLCGFLESVEVTGPEVLRINGSDVPVRDGVARFRDDDGYNDSFARQWKEFRLTQYDSSNGTSLTRDRYLRETGWPDAGLEGESMLEAGCGAGRFTRILAGTGATLLSFDYSSAVDVSAEQNGQFSNVAFAQADIFDLPFAPASFDAVVSALSLHWVNDLPGALVQARQCLKPDGLFLGAMLGGETLHELRAVLTEAESDVLGGAGPRVSPFAELQDAAGLMQRAGFALPVVDSDLLTVTYENAFLLMRELRGMGEGNAVAARRKSATPKSVFLRAAEIYQQRHSTPDGRIAASFQILYLTGWAPHASQQKPLRPGSAAHRLADALEATERPAGDIAAPGRKAP